MIEISVVIPVYNSERVIARCIKAVLNQSFKNFELIIVDDGSTDLTFEICSNFAKSDKRIKLINQINGGVSNARNNGMKASCGEWICFIDSDDYVNDLYLENLMKSSADFVISGLNILKDNRTISIKPPNFIVSNRIDLVDFISMLESTGFVIYGPCQKRYKLEILTSNGIFFDESLSYGEDTIFNIKYFEKINTAVSISVADYYYVQNSEGSLSSLVSFDKRFAYIKHLEESLNSLIFSFSEDLDKININGLVEMLSKQCYSTIKLCYISNHSYYERYNNIERIRKVIENSKWFNFNYYRIIEISFFLTLKYGLNIILDVINYSFIKLKRLR